VENVAYNKESWISNRRQVKRHVRARWKHGRAGQAVDGVADSSLNMCTVLDNFDVDRPVWMVNLGRKVKITGVVILTWLGRRDQLAREYRQISIARAINPLMDTGNYSATSNNMKLVQWPLHWYSEQGTGRGRSPSRPLLAVPNVTAHPSTASVPITALLYNGTLHCGFNVPIKGLTRSHAVASNSAIVAEDCSKYCSFCSPISRKL